MAQLEVDNIHTAYGLSKVLFGVSLRVESGEVVSLVGRNGVGKTTTIRSIMGMAPPQEGSVRWNDRDITGIPVHRVSKLGIGYVPEDRRIFPELTVWENLDLGRRPPIDGAGGGGWSEEQVFELFPDLRDIQGRKGGVLSGGQQQMLTIARGLMGNPKLLLLDEPSEGLAPIVAEMLRDRIHMLRTGGLSIVLAEQNLDFVLFLSDRVHILEKGKIVYTGTPADLHDNPAIQTEYLTV